MQQLPDGYIVKTENPDDSFLVYGELSGRGFVSKGYRLEIPNLGNANNGLKNDLFFRLSGWLASQTLDKRIQVRYTRDADYRDILASYQEDTARKTTAAWSRHIRNEIAEEINRKISARILRREYVDLYFSRKLGMFLKGGLMPESPGERAAFEREVAAAFARDMSDAEAFLALPVRPLGLSHYSGSFTGRSINPHLIWRLTMSRLLSTGLPTFTIVNTPESPPLNRDMSASRPTVTFTTSSRFMISLKRILCRFTVPGCWKIPCRI